MAIVAVRVVVGVVFLWGVASSAPAQAVRGPDPAPPSEPAVVPPAVERVLARVELLTGRSFATRPAVEVLDADAWAVRMRERVAQRVRPSTLAGLQTALRALGALPADVDLVAAWNEWGAPRSGAYFDVARDTLVVRFGAAEPLRDHGELVRAALLALRSETADLAPLDRPDATLTSDRTRAFEALAEGEVSYWRRRYGMRFSDELADEFVQRSPAEWTHESAPIAPPQIPAFVVAHTAFAADAGERFVQALQDAGGADAVERAWRLPPRSTEQVLWPDKIRDSEGVDEPHVVTARDVVDLLPPGFAPCFDAEFGAAGTELVLRLGADPMRALLAQRGFGGDRVRAYAHADGRVVVQWVIASDTTADAIESFDAVCKILERSYAPTKDAANRVVVDAERTDARATTLANEVLGAVRRKAETLVLYTGLDQTMDVEKLALRALE